jgi:hypothetical protein
VAVGGEKDADRLVRQVFQLGRTEVDVPGEHGPSEGDRKDQPVELLCGELRIVEPQELAFGQVLQARGQRFGAAPGAPLVVGTP